jgi:bacillolysin
MKNILLLLFALPVTVFAQLKTVSFNIDNFPAKIDEQSVSSDLATFLGISGEFAFEQEKNKKTVTNKRNERHVTYQQYYHGFPIEHTAIKLHYRNDKLYYINGEYLPAIANIASTPKLGEQQAFESAKQYTGAETYIWDNQESMKILPRNSSTELLFPAPHAQLVIYCPPVEKGESVAFMAYKFDVYAIRPLSRNYVYVDAYTGKIVGAETRINSVNGTADTRYSGQRVIGTDAAFGHFRLRDYDSDRGNGIETFNMQNGSDYWGAIDFADDDNDWTAAEFDNGDKDNAALDAHWGAIMTYDYFNLVHGRNSIDDNGAVMRNYVHCDLHGFGLSSNGNAFWDGSAMHYGDGDSHYDVVVALDIVAHEIGHGLCTNTAALVYYGEAGAINESLSDIWGACVENYATNDKETWLHSEDVIITSPYYERSFSDPNSGRIDQPDTYEGDDWAGGSSPDPHINSGVMNHWFYLLAEGGSGTNDNNDDFDVTGIGIEDAAQIVFLAETEYMTSGTDLDDARVYTIQAAQDIFGNCSQQVRSVIDAWYAVGIGSSFEIFDEKHITVNVSPSTVQNVFAVTLLEASNVIGASSTIRYQSSGEVVLSPEFSTDGATNFVAEIIPCIDLQNGKKDNVKESNEFINRSTTLNTEDGFSIEIFPNPVTESLNIIFSKDKVENTVVHIADASNKLVKSFKVSSKLSEVNVSDLAAGFYFINIMTGGKRFSSKIIKN